MVDRYKAFINGEWAEALNGGTMEIINPANGRVCAQVAKCGAEEIEKAVTAAAQAAPGWGKELSKMALEKYTLTKHIYVALTGQPEKPWYGILK